MSNGFNPRITNQRSMGHSATGHSAGDDKQLWARRWRTWLRTLGLAGGERSTSRVKHLDVLHGRVVAQVQERNGNSCDVEIRFAQWNDEEWQRVVDAMSSQALFAAQLLAGNLPPDLDRIIASTGIQILPTSVNEITHECSCQIDQRKVCEHVMAVYTALGELLPEDPWLLFRLRGRDQQSLLRNLSSQRARNEPSQSTQPSAKPDARRNGDSGFYRATANAASEEEIPRLQDQIANFWGSMKAQQDFRPHILSPTVELALLRRLGPPPLGAAAASTYDALSILYRRISKAALDLAYAADNNQADSNSDDSDS